MGPPRALGNVQSIGRASETTGSTTAQRAGREAPQTTNPGANKRVTKMVLVNLVVLVVIATA
eukprot:2644767-Lingulodinium_polyedra.AAC.1